MVQAGKRTQEQAEKLTKKQLQNEGRELLGINSDILRWTNLKYFIPMTEDFRWVTLSVSAIINLQKKEKNKTVHFGRIFMGIRNKEAPRQLQSFTKIDWSSSKKFQILDDDEGEYEIEDLSPKNTAIVQLFKAEKVGPEVEIEEVGFSIIPIIEDSGFPIVGLYALPVFQSQLTEQII